MLKWVSEEDRLPKIGQKVLLLSPRQGGGWWDPSIAMILVRYEGVVPLPINKGAKWPVNYYWSDGRTNSHTLITGNAYWAALDEINLPPGAEHYSDVYGHEFQQVGFEWVGPRP